MTATYSRTAGETVAGSPYTISATLSPAGVLGIQHHLQHCNLYYHHQACLGDAGCKEQSVRRSGPHAHRHFEWLPDGRWRDCNYSRTPGETVAGSPTPSAPLSAPRECGTTATLQHRELYHHAAAGYCDGFHGHQGLRWHKKFSGHSDRYVGHAGGG